MSNIKVAVRVRPPIEREIRNGEEPIWRTSGNTIYTESGKNTLHTFDHVFHSSSTNQEVYEKCCHPLVESVMLGFNGTIFAFGQTSSGKTHTMMGNSSQPGLIPLTIDAIFDIIQNMPEREYLLRISYMEIYNENVLDLLDDSYGKHLQIRDNADGQPVISDLTEVTVGSKEEIESVMTSGERRRHVASTEANQRSSRSHTIFRMVIESSVRGGTDDAVTVGQLNLVDLAGSERSEQCGDMGERFRESTRINVSLTFLTQVISKLSRGERGHINFRDSKLTRILRNSLGGNAHTAIVCTVNPCCMEQTLRTLQFASSAKKIQNTPKVNEILTNEALIRRYHKQIEVLNRQLKATEGSSLCKTIQEKNSQIYELKSKVSSLERKLLVSSIPQKRKQRRETWAAPRSTDSVPEPLVCPLSQMGTPLSYASVDSPDMVRGRLSTVVEESESFLAIPYDQFERQLQREERMRRSAVLSSRDTTPDCLNVCCSATCSERIAFLESELAILRKEHQELKELTTLEQLLCSTSRRPTSSEKQAESTVQDLPCESVHTSPSHISSEKVDPVLSTPLSSLNECCVQTLLASRRHLKRESSAAFFSPIAASPALAKHDSSEASSAATSPDNCPSRESLQAPGLHTPRTVLWTPKNSPAVCMNVTPVESLKTVYACKPLCFARTTQTDDMPCLQAPLHVATQSVQTEDCGMSQQVHTSAVDAMCQTDSEDTCEMPKPLTFELLSGAEHLDHSTMNVSYSEKPLVTSAEVQTTGSGFSILEEQPDRPELTDAAVSCCVFFEQFVECGVQTEACAREFSAMELTKQEVACVPACAAEQVPVLRAFVQSCSVQASVITKDSESQINTSLTDDYRADLGTQTLMPSSTCSGVQAIPDTEDCLSQVNTSLAEDYRTDFGVHAVADMLSCASQVDVQFTRKWATDCAVQCELLTENRGSETSGCNTVDCWVQATVLVQECAAQTQCLLQCDFTDSGVQVIPPMQDCETQHEPSIGEMLQCAVQTSPRSVCDNFTQHECLAPPATVTTTPHSCSLRLCDEAQAVSLARSSPSQVKEFLTPQESSASKISNSSVTGKMRRTFCVKNILAGRPGGFKPPEVSTPTPASESTRSNQSRYPCGDMDALGASQHRRNEYGERWALSAGHQKAADYTSPAVRTTAFVTKPWLQRSETVTQGKESVAVQADIWTTQGMNYKDHQVEKYKKALQELESQYKLQEKAVKKREIQLKAAIRELKNKDVDTRVRASHENPPATPATSTESDAPQQPEAVALAAESPTSFARRLKAMTPISREGARLIYFGQSLKERALAEEVQRAQLKASLSSHTQRLASAQRRHQAWAERSSHTADADPRSPLKEQNQKNVRESSPDSAKDEVLAEMACWPPMKFVMDYKENLDSP